MDHTIFVRYPFEEKSKLTIVYKVDDELIGISVTDILPTCISSVYFIWHPDWAWASLGKLSALHEIALSVEMNRAGLENMKFLYMGTSLFDLIRLGIVVLMCRILDLELYQDEIQIRIFTFIPPRPWYN